MNIKKIQTARKTLKAIQNDLEFDIWADSHPQEEQGLNRLLELLTKLKKEELFSQEFSQAIFVFTNKSPLYLG